MKNYFISISCVVLVLLTCMCTSCGDDDKVVDPANIVGTWKYTYDKGFAICVFNADGTGSDLDCKIKNDEGRDICECSRNTFVYSYNAANGEISFRSGSDEFQSTITWVNNNTYNSTEDGGSTWVRQNITQSKTAIHGAWKYTFPNGKGYDITVYKEDGTVSAIEYKAKDKEGNPRPYFLILQYYYSYDPASKIIHEWNDDWEDDCFTTWTNDNMYHSTWDSGSDWVKIAIEHTAADIVGTWKYTFNNNSGYCLLTFNANGSGTYYEYDNGQSKNYNLYYKFMPEINYLCWGERPDDMDEEGVLTWYGNNQFFNTWDSGSTWIKQTQK